MSNQLHELYPPAPLYLIAMLFMSSCQFILLFLLVSASPCCIMFSQCPAVSYVMLCFCRWVYLLCFFLLLWNTGFMWSHWMHPKGHSAISAYHAHCCMCTTCLWACVCLCLHCLMNLLCSDWKLIKTASNRRPPTGSQWQHTDWQITAVWREGGRERGREGGKRVHSYLMHSPRPHMSGFVPISAPILLLFPSTLQFGLNSNSFPKRKLSRLFQK